MSDAIRTSESCTTCGKARGHKPNFCSNPWHDSIPSKENDELIDRVCRGVASTQEGQQLREYIAHLQRIDCAECGAKWELWHDQYCRGNQGRNGENGGGLTQETPAHETCEQPKNWAVWQCLIHQRLFAAHAGCSYCSEGRAPTHDCNGSALKALLAPREWHFDRYRAGKLMAEGVVVRNKATLKEALEWAQCQYPPYTDTFKLRDEKKTNAAPAESILDHKVTVCSACLCACCIQGSFYCDDYKTAGTVEKTVRELWSGNLRESSEYWFKDASTGETDYNAKSAAKRALDAERAALNGGGSHGRG